MTGEPLYNEGCRYSEAFGVGVNMGMKKWRSRNELMVLYTHDQSRNVEVTSVVIFYNCLYNMTCKMIKVITVIIASMMCFFNSGLMC